MDGWMDGRSHAEPDRVLSYRALFFIVEESISEDELSLEAER